MVIDVVRAPFGNNGWQAVSQHFASSKGIILYHGTSSKFLERILDEGILPRRMTGKSNYAGKKFAGKSLESNPELVYLIHRYGIHFGGQRAVNKYGGEVIGLRVFLPDFTSLVADEDSRKSNWHDSVAYEESCAHRGPISPEHIIGLFRFSKVKRQYTPLRPHPEGITLFDWRDEYRRYAA